MSALATIVGGLGELSESELRQLYLMVGVRLGNPDVPTGVKIPQGGGTGTSRKRPKTTGGKTAKSSTSSKGNPQRKSQWANHPLYQEYSRLKKVVEAQAKEQRCSFNAVDTAESRAYRTAFTQWVEAKSSFRGHGESGQIRESPEERRDASSDEESEDEEAEAPSSSKQTKSASPQPTPAGTGKSSSPSGKSRESPPAKGKVPTK